MKKNIISFIFSFILLIYLPESFAQYGTLRGSIIDSLKGESLPFANIVLEGTKFGAAADLHGNFIITGIPANKEYTLKTSFLGYNTKEQTVFIKVNSVLQINIELFPISVELQAIEKIGEKYDRPNETNLGLQKITIKELELLPKGVETDIFRSLQMLPGVQSTGDVSARYYVRGGGSNQNLVLLNGVSVYNPFHALGLFSIIDPEMINAVEFFKGGFTAEYGGRLSSVLNLVTKDGNKNRFGGNATISFLTGKAAVEGPIPGGSFLITGRKSLFNSVLKKFLNYKDAPFEFHDLSFKANYTNSNTESLTKIFIHGFNSRDQLLNNDPEKADFKWINNIYGAYWFQAWKDVPIYSEAVFSISNFEGKIDPKLSTAKTRQNNLDDLTFKTDFTYIYDSNDEVKVGYNFKVVSSGLKQENLQGHKTEINDKGVHLSVYGKYKFLRFENFGIDIGTRVNAITLAKDRSATFEPRANITYNIFPGVALKGAWGIYTQELITLTDENEIISLFEPWLITPKYLKVSDAIQYMGGIDIKIFEDLNFSAEGYFKDIKHSAEINDKKASADDPDFVQGKAEAYGGEFQLKYLTPFIQATASYSLSWAYRDVNGWISYPKYDSRHLVNVHLNFDFGDGWQAGASWFFNSGLPFTQIQAFYDKLYFDDLSYSGSLYGYYKPFTILGDKNIGRLPTYHRLDLNVSKKFNLLFTNFYVSVSAMNVYDRKNIFYFERDTGKRVNMVPFLPTATLKIEI